MKYALWGSSEFPSASGCDSCILFRAEAGKSLQIKGDGYRYGTRTRTGRLPVVRWVVVIVWLTPPPQHGNSQQHNNSGNGRPLVVTLSVLTYSFVITHARTLLCYSRSSYTVPEGASFIRLYDPSFALSQQHHE